MSTPNPFRLQAEFNIQAAAEGEARTPTFDIQAYSGDAIRQYWSRYPMVVDLAGMTATTPMPALYGHSGDGGFTGKPLDGLLGQITAAENNGRSLRVAGDMIGEGETFDRVVSLSRKGFRFQASIGADVHRTEFVEAGNKVTVNGREFTGPISVVRASTLREVSIVLMGADPNTSAAIAAQANNGGDPMAHDANNTPAEPIQASAEGAASVAAGSENKAPLQTPPVDIDGIVAKAVDAAVGQVKAAMLEQIRGSRPHVPAAHVVSKPADDEKTIVAALCLHGNLQNVESHFDERTLEAAHQRRGMGLQEMILRAAKANGFDRDVYRLSSDGLIRDALRAAFSTHSIANVTAATYGKFLLTGFNFVESVWDRITLIRPVTDFKAVTGVRINGGFEFEEVGPSGELKNADATDEARSFGAKTYGRISTITRRDIRNDDLGALTIVPTRLGIGAATKFNKVFWTEFQTSNDTYYLGASAAGGNALAIGSMESAYTAYGQATDPSGNPLGAVPSIILVPKGLGIAARKLNASANMIVSGTTSSRVLEPQTNVLAGMLDPVESAYLTTAQTAANSTWWLATAPGLLNAMEALFLDGNRFPTIEQAEADFDVLGIAVRGYHDFGVAKGESRACYRMATA